jgi:hypothetical protein
LRNDDVLEIVILKDKVISLIEAKEITQNIIQVTKNIPRKTILIAEEFAIGDLDAVKYSTTPESMNPIFVLAIVTQSLPQVILANFIIRVKRPLIPTKLFNSVIEAEQWLKLQ